MTLSVIFDDQGTKNTEEVILGEEIHTDSSKDKESTYSKIFLKLLNRPEKKMCEGVSHTPKHGTKEANCIF